MSDNKCTYGEFLQTIKPQIGWQVTLDGEDRTVYSQAKQGFFEILTLQECKMLVRELERMKYASPGLIANLVSGLLEDADRVLDPELFRLCRARIIGFKNGVFDLQLGKMRDYTSNDFVVSPLPHIIPEHVDPDVESWFLGILSDWVGTDAADWFCNLLAYVLFIFPNNENLWLNLFEAGRNGKSLCMKLLEKIVGDDKAIGCDLGHINRFSNATFQGKWLILGRDSSSFVSDSAASFIKNYSGEVKALVEIKGGASFDTYTTGKIIVSTNNLIQSKDRSFGWYRRLLPIPFPNTFPLNEDFEKNLFKQIPKITRVLLHRAYCYKQNKILISQSLPLSVATLKEETRYLNDRVVAFWELEFFDKSPDEEGIVKPRPVAAQFLKFHNLTMSAAYDSYTYWHHAFFGDGVVEPSLKSFGGPYGAFMTHAKEYFTYNRRKDGRYLELRKKYYQHFITGDPILL